MFAAPTVSSTIESDSHKLEGSTTATHEHEEGTSATYSTDKSIVTTSTEEEKVTSAIENEGSTEKLYVSHSTLPSAAQTTTKTVSISETESELIAQQVDETTTYGTTQKVIQTQYHEEGESVPKYEPPQPSAQPEEDISVTHEEGKVTVSEELSYQTVSAQEETTYGKIVTTKHEEGLVTSIVEPATTPSSVPDVTSTPEDVSNVTFKEDEGVDVIGTTSRKPEQIVTEETEVVTQANENVYEITTLQEFPVEEGKSTGTSEINAISTESGISQSESEQTVPSVTDKIISLPQETSEEFVPEVTASSEGGKVVVETTTQVEVSEKETATSPPSDTFEASTPVPVVSEVATATEGVVTLEVITTKSQVHVTDSEVTTEPPVEEQTSKLQTPTESPEIESGSSTAEEEKGVELTKSPEDVTQSPESQTLRTLTETEISVVEEHVQTSKPVPSCGKEGPCVFPEESKTEVPAPTEHEGLPKEHEVDVTTVEPNYISEKKQEAVTSKDEFGTEVTNIQDASTEKHIPVESTEKSTEEEPVTTKSVYDEVQVPEQQTDESVKLPTTEYEGIKVGSVEITTEVAVDEGVTELEAKPSAPVEHEPPKITTEVNVELTTGKSQLEDVTGTEREPEKSFTTQKSIEETTTGVSSVPSENAVTEYASEKHVPEDVTTAKSLSADLESGGEEVTEGQVKLLPEEEGVTSESDTSGGLEPVKPQVPVETSSARVDEITTQVIPSEKPASEDHKTEKYPTVVTEPTPKPIESVTQEVVAGTGSAVQEPVSQQQTTETSESSTESGLIQEPVSESEVGVKPESELPHKPIQPITVPETIYLSSEIPQEFITKKYVEVTTQKVIEEEESGVPKGTQPPKQENTVAEQEISSTGTSENGETTLKPTELETSLDEKESSTFPPSPVTTSKAIVEEPQSSSVSYHETSPETAEVEKESSTYLPHVTTSKAVFHEEFSSSPSLHTEKESSTYLPHVVTTPKAAVYEEPLTPSFLVPSELQPVLTTLAPHYRVTSTTHAPDRSTKPVKLPEHHTEEPVHVEDSDYDEEPGAFGPGTCRYAGKIYVSAQQIPRDDPCDFCFCFRSDIICLQQSCPPPIPRCHEEPIRGFCCPRYECPVNMGTTVNVTTTTTTTTTTLPPHFLSHAYKGRATRAGCLIQGQTYQVGEVIKASSGPCLHCM